jgi:enamine deaminase RidA (YjgF/YER057c/UK114 family)
MAERRRVTSHSPFEGPIGFSRAIRAGDRVLVSGTGPVWPDGSCDPDVYQQAMRAFKVGAGALSELGASLRDVVRTRMYLLDASDWEAVGRAHSAYFEAVRPAATMVVVAGLLDPRWRIEVELEAVAGEEVPARLVQ